MATGLAQSILEAIEKGTPFYSFEVFPPASQQGVEALYVPSKCPTTNPAHLQPDSCRCRRLDVLAKEEPEFIAVTCGHGMENAQQTLRICQYIQQVRKTDSLPNAARAPPGLT
mgnify:CR=1 FL=1